MVVHTAEVRKRRKHSYSATALHSDGTEILRMSGREFSILSRRQAKPCAAARRRTPAHRRSTEQRGEIAGAGSALHRRQDAASRAAELSKSQQNARPCAAAPAAHRRTPRSAVLPEARQTSAFNSMQADLNAHPGDWVQRDAGSNDVETTQGQLREQPAMEKEEETAKMKGECKQEFGDQRKAHEQEMASAQQTAKEQNQQLVGKV